MERKCTDCQYTKTCQFVDHVQNGSRPCPLDSRMIVERLDVSTILGQIREARRRTVNMRELGIKIISPLGLEDGK